MNRFLPLLLALAFSAFAVALALFVVRPRMDTLRVATGDWRHRLDEVIEEVTDRKEEDR